MPLKVTVDVGRKIVAGALLASVALLTTASQADEQWVYGNHPVLGLSAYVGLENGNAIGLACNKADFSPIDDNFVAIRVTNGLTNAGALDARIAPDGYTLTFPGSEGRERDGYIEYVGNTCMTNVLPLQSGSGISSTSPAWSVGLRGSSAALKKLIAACPSMRRDIAENCGI